MQSFIKCIIVSIIMHQVKSSNVLPSCIQYPPFEKVSTTSGFSQFQIDALIAHNKYRYVHGVPPLTLSKTICDHAAAWAQKLFDENKFEHSDSIYGQNLYWTSVDVSRVDGQNPVDNWYAESEGYPYDGQFYATTGHFTQTIWVSTTEFGIAAVGDAKKGTFVVAEYNPPGNYIGEFAENVPRPIANIVNCDR